MRLNKMSNIKVLIVDNHTLFAQGTMSILSFCAEIQVVGIANSGIECIELTMQTSPDVILLDIFLPDSNGIDLIKELQEIQPRIKVLILTGHNPQGFINKSIRSGANGFLLKECNAKELVKAITSVYEGELYFSPLIQIVPKNEDNDNSQTSKNIITNNCELTPKEKTIMQMISIGLHNKEIASVMHISTRTVDFHVSNILLKLDVDTRLEALIKWNSIGNTYMLSVNTLKKMYG